MKLGVLCTVYNEGLFLDYSIKSYIDHVDNIAIVEGAYLETVALGKPERSNDGTLEIIEKYKENQKVNIDHVNLQTDRNHRNVGLERLRQSGCDWLLIVDGDECYHEIDFQFIRKEALLYTKHNIKAAYFQSLTFVNDFNHYTIQSFPRLFKITPGCTFVNDNFMQWENASWAAPHVIKSNTKFYHYSFCKGRERFETKAKWWETRFGTPFNYGWMIDENGIISDKNHKIYEFTGRHPKVILEHPLYKDKK
jgi:glycosyltransferase involved in cell wall biosynthesis